MSGQYADIRKQLESDEQLASLMAGLRGSNLNDSDYAEEGVTMSLVEVCSRPREALLIVSKMLWLSWSWRHDECCEMKNCHGLPCMWSCAV